MEETATYILQYYPSQQEKVKTLLQSLKITPLSDFGLGDVHFTRILTATSLLAKIEEEPTIISVTKI